MNNALYKVLAGYHEVMERFYSAQYERIFNACSTNEAMVLNAGRLEKLCVSAISHTERIFELSPEKSKTYNSAVERRANLTKILEITKNYAKAGVLEAQLAKGRT